MKQLIEEQEKEFERSELCKRITTTEMYAINHGFPEWKGESVMDWHKQSLKQFIDELIAREEKEIKKTDKFVLFQRIHHVEAKNETIAHLKKLKEELN